MAEEMMTVSIYIYISLAVYVAYDVTVSFFTIVFGLNIEIVVSIVKPTMFTSLYVLHVVKVMTSGT